MTTLNATEARSKLYSLIDEANENHKPIVIKGKRANAVLLSEDDWNAINETLYLVSFRECGNPSSKELRPMSMNATGISIGDVGTPLHKPSQERREILASSGLKGKAQELLEILSQNPFQNPPPYEKPVGDLAGAYSRRINIQHRLVYQVLEPEGIVKVLRMWTHYE